MAKKTGTLGPSRVWALAAGGMVGGGIYIALGVVIAAAAQWSWLSFAIAGIVAISSAFSYARLSNTYQRSGGAFEFLEEMHHKGMAGSLTWMLILGYTLTISVYIFAFAHYVAYAFDGGQATIITLSITAGLGLILLNLTGLGKMTAVELVIVSLNLVALLILAIWGFAHWNTASLTAGIEPRPIWSSCVGAAAIFVSYEGFQLLTYEYEEIKDAKKTLTPVLVSAAVFVVIVYIGVALGATMILGALNAVERPQVALSIAAEQAAGTPGLIAMTIAAGCATAAAINSTLFSTAKLAARVARDQELPSWFTHQNSRHVPDRAIIFIGLIALALALTGSLSTLVEAASLTFLVAFLIVNVLCFRESKDTRWLPAIGISVGGLIGLVLLARLMVSAPIPLGVLTLLTLLICLGRPTLLQATQVTPQGEEE